MGAAFGLENFGDGGGVLGVGAEAVDGFGAEGDEFAGRLEGGGFGGAGGGGGENAGHMTLGA